MGIRNLNALILRYANKGFQKKHLSCYSGKILLIDANIFLYKYLYGNKNHINGIFFQINKLKKYSIEPIYVFEGKPPVEKQNTIHKRKRQKENIKNKILNYHEEIKNTSKEEDITKFKNLIKKLEKKLVYINKDVIDKTKNLLKLMGVKYIEADCEAEQLCAYLVRHNYAHGIISEDMDTLACGSKILIKNYTNKNDYILEYNLESILNDFHFSFDQFINLCILCGTDYNNRIKGLSHFEIFNLVKNNSELSMIYKKGSKLNKLLNIKKIFYLENINVDKEILSYISSKTSPNIVGLKKYMAENSDIKKELYNNRIYLMFIKKKQIYRNNYITNLKKKYQINKNGNPVLNS